MIKEGCPVKKTVFCLLLAAALLLAFGCRETPPAAAPDARVVFTDALGFAVPVDRPQRVAALTGSFAETWLLAGGTLAALTADAYSERGILPDESVVNLGDLKSPDAERILEAGIDFAILSSNISGHVKLRETLENAGVTTAYFEVETFDEYLSMLKICTDITGRADLYAQNGTSVRRQIDDVIQKNAGKPAPSVLLIRAFSTGAKAKGADSMTGAMLRDLGCDNIVDRHPSLLEDLSMEEIILADPDFIFVTTMGASSEAAVRALAEGVQSNPAWRTLSAVQNGRYFVLPRSLFHYKPNNRWGESYEMLSDILYGA